MAVEFACKQHYDTRDLLEIMRILRSPEGCPWDREQTHHSIRGDFLEETHEALEAIDREDSDGLQEELGDVLLQVVFHACIEEEVGGFTYDDIVDTLCKKLVTRHPHVFGDLVADNVGDALKNWDAVKRQNKTEKTQTKLLEGVPRSLPSLMRARKVIGRAKRVGFEQTDTPLEAIEQMEKRLAVLKSVVSEGNVDDAKLGELLFATVELSAKLQIDAEQALSVTTNQFIDRFAAMEKQIRDRGDDIADVSKATWKELQEQEFCD